MMRNRSRFHETTWYRSVLDPVPEFPPVEGTHRVRTAIVGAGLAGLSTAFSLMQKGHDGIAVLDAGQPGHGASGRNGGFVFAGYSLSNDRLVRVAGADTARRLHRWTRDAVDRVRARCRMLDCPVNDRGVLLADWFGDERALEAFRSRMAETLDFHLEPVARDQMSGYVRSSRYGGGLLEPGSFHFNPLQYLCALAGRLAASGNPVFGDSPVLELSRESASWRVRTPGGELIADRVVLCTGGYVHGICPVAENSIQPIATYIMVTEPLGRRIEELIPTPVAVYDTRFAFDYFRPLADSRLLWGGRISIRDRAPEAIEVLLRQDLLRVFPQLGDVGIDYRWGGWMSYARHQMPILRHQGDGLWLGTAFGGHGMAITTLGGEILAEAIGGEPERIDAFARWRPVHAGGRLGRWAVQGVYSWKQLRDGLRDRMGLGKRFPTKK